MVKFIDLSGKIFGRLTVLSEYFIKNRKTYWKCSCSCGTIKYIRADYLRSGEAQSCKCLRIEKLIDRNSKHLMSYDRFYNIYNKIKQRCLNPKATGYDYYGGRGITICDRWKESFENFKEDMYESYLTHYKKYREDTSIDRIDCNGNYYKENCRWATGKMQTFNRRPNKNNKNFLAISPDGTEYICKSITNLAKEHNLTISSISHCLSGKYKIHKGWTFKNIDPCLFIQDLI